MRIYDISRTIKNGMPVWPGDPEVRLNWLSQISKGGAVNLTEIQMCAHSGTHIDTPNHFLDHGLTTDALDLSVLIGKAKVVVVPPEIKVINDNFLRTLKLGGVERILFKTENGDLLNESTLTFREDFVALDASGARVLANSGCRLVGIDAMSIAVFNDPDGGHIPILEAGVLVLEGLNLREVEEGEYQLIALPLKLSGREGAPVRAVLLEQHK